MIREGKWRCCVLLSLFPVPINDFPPTACVYVYVCVYIYIYIYIYIYTVCSGPGSSVGIATDYGLYGPGLNPDEDELFRPSRPALGTT